MCHSALQYQTENSLNIQHRVRHKIMLMEFYTTIKNDVSEGLIWENAYLMILSEIYVQSKIIFTPW